MPGKVWNAEEEAQLRALVEANLNVDEIAAKLKKSPKAVITKSQRLEFASCRICALAVNRQS